MIKNDLVEIKIPAGELKIDPKTLAMLMGVEGPTPEPYKGIIDAELEQTANYSDIAGGYRIMEAIELDMDENAFTVKGTAFKPGRQVMTHLRNSEMLAFYICTAGEQVGLRSKELMNSGQLLEGYVADLVGSVLAEEAMDYIHKILVRSREEHGLKTTNRYSPGYCDWKVDEQHQLFSLFPENFCGVVLNESALMHPVKSVSGVIGLGPKVRFHKYVCHACSNVNCIYRNLKYRI